MLKLEENKTVFKGQYIRRAHEEHRVKSSLFQSDGFEFKDLYGKNTTACYSWFFNSYNSKTYCNRLYTEHIHVPTSVKLTKEDAVAWLKLLVDENFLPEYTDPKICVETPEDEYAKKIGVKKDQLLIRLTYDITNLPAALLYIYLDTARHLRDDPGFVKSVLHMVNEKGIDFYIAFVLASYFNIGNSGHHSIHISTNYTYTQWNKPHPDHINHRLNLNACRALYRFMNDPKANLGKTLGTHQGRAITWNCNNLVQSQTNKDLDLSVAIKHLDDPRVMSIVTEFDDDKAKAKYKNFLNKKKETK